MAKKKQPDQPEGERPKPRRRKIRGNRGSLIELQLVKRRLIVARLHEQGVELQEIAKRLNISVASAHRDKELVLEDYQNETAEYRQRIVAKSLVELDAVKYEAWQSWAKSLLNAETIIETNGTGKKDKSITKRTEGQCGDATYLDKIIRAIEARAKLLGLYVQPEDKAGTEDGQARTRQQIVIFLKGFGIDLPTPVGPKSLNAIDEAPDTPHTNGNGKSKRKPPHSNGD